MTEPIKIRLEGGPLDGNAMTFTDCEPDGPMQTAWGDYEADPERPDVWVFAAPKEEGRG